MAGIQDEADAVLHGRPVTVAKLRTEARTGGERHACQRRQRWPQDTELYRLFGADLLAEASLVG